MHTLKTIWSLLAGFIVVVVLSIVTDLILEKTGMMRLPFHENSTHSSCWSYSIVVFTERWVLTSPQSSLRTNRCDIP